MYEFFRCHRTQVPILEYEYNLEILGRHLQKRSEQHADGGAFPRLNCSAPRVLRPLLPACVSRGGLSAWSPSRDFLTRSCAFKTEAHSPSSNSVGAIDPLSTMYVTILSLTKAHNHQTQPRSPASLASARPRGLLTIPGAFEAMAFVKSGISGENDDPDLELELTSLFPSPDIGKSRYVTKYLWLADPTLWLIEVENKFRCHRVRSVKGFTGLRVVDASVMPSIVSGNTYATVMMIGAKGADLILKDAKARQGVKS
ncbi:hypothetical protein HPB49_019164 [Dermacentor silvarum]|uniref:Uncharacterized protein n=1 Tax=Dermacentor silvarum TaxID=543639 RepID=A0ACB8CSE4_DERSI|nr:hypothetical protein HPB49_019164 [Dermacentor silvarum]